MSLQLKALTSLLTLGLMLPFASYAEPINNTGLRLMRETSLIDGAKGNVMTSPVSMYLALSMALNGTEAATRDALLKSLDIHIKEADLAVDSVNEMNFTCQKVLSVAADAPRHRWDPPGPVVTIANGAWHTNGKTDGVPFRFSPTFVKNLQSTYLAEMGAMDFKNPEAANQINAWVDNKTNGLIKKVLTPNETQALIFLLINTTYFEAAWEKPFIKVTGRGNNDKSTNFTLSDGQVKSVPMIKNNDHYNYIATPSEEVIEIPFVTSENSSYVFRLVLPKDSRKALVDYWAPAFWEQLSKAMNQQQPQKGTIQMPVFSFDYNLTMKDQEPLTKAMNLDYLFLDTAQFGAMSTPESVPAKVGLIKQLTRIELDEKGVKAAAATVVGGVRATSIEMPRPDKFNMLVNRPFVFIITEKKTDKMLFIGSVIDPTL